jgi:maleate isomerase
METELPQLMRRRATTHPSETFTFHSARMRMRTVNQDELELMNQSTERAAHEIADVRPNVVATACLVAIMAQGPGFHRTAEASIGSVLDIEEAAAPVVSSAGSLVVALRAVGATRVALITPYVKPLTSRVVDYLEAEGIAVHDALSLEVQDNHAVAALDQRNLLEHAKRLSVTGCDALVVSACVQMPSLDVIDAVEEQARVPVLSAATATAWAILRALELDAAIPGAGSLLRPVA